MNLDGEFEFDFTLKYIYLHEDKYIESYKVADIDSIIRVCIHDLLSTVLTFEQESSTHNWPQPNTMINKTPAYKLIKA